jgi:protein involved in polysaccharide export with SLBB domain
MRDNSFATIVVLFVLTASVVLAQTNPIASQSNTSPINAPTVTQSQTGLLRFGANLFQLNESSPSELNGGALPPDYLLGPGDQLSLFLTGQSEDEPYQLIVSVDGQIYIPTLGFLYVNGLTLGQFRALVDDRVRAIYSSYDLNIMLTVPKLVGVSVIGEVVKPGNYSGSALSSALDFVTRAQGLTPEGSLRDIQVFRQDSLVANIDLYDFILRPTGRQSFSLQSGDIIFVPVIKNSVEVMGEVNREAIYELNPNKPERLCDLIDLAGGFTRFSYLNKIEVSSVVKNGRTARYIDFSSDPCMDDSLNLVLKDKDRIRVFSLEDQAPKDSVAIHGEVNVPGPYEFQYNMRVSDLILQAGNLTRSAYMLQAEVAKVDPGNKISNIRVDLQKLMNGDESVDILLEPDDQVFIRKIPNWELGALVEVRGEVKFPGFYLIVMDTTRLSDIINQAGGFTDEALIGESKLERKHELVIEDKEFERLSQMSRADMSESEYEYLVMKHNSDNINEIVVDFNKLMLQGHEAEDVLLKDGDVIHVPKRPDVIYVSGRVSKPGGILFMPGKNFDYYIKKSGGYTWDANKRRTKIIKVTGEIKSVGAIKNFEPGDRIFVPRKSDRDFWRVFYDSVMVLGQLAAVYLVIRTATN